MSNEWDDVQRREILERMRKVREAVRRESRRDDLVERALECYWKETGGRQLGDRKVRRYIPLKTK